MDYLRTANTVHDGTVKTGCLQARESKNSDIKFETSQATSTNSLQASLHSPALGISIMPPALARNNSFRHMLTPDTEDKYEGLFRHYFKNMDVTKFFANDSDSFSYLDPAQLTHGCLVVELSPADTTFFNELHDGRINGSDVSNVLFLILIDSKKTYLYSADVITRMGMHDLGDIPFQQNGIIPSKNDASNKSTHHLGDGVHSVSFVDLMTNNKDPQVITYESISMGFLAYQTNLNRFNKVYWRGSFFECPPTTFKQCNRTYSFPVLPKHAFARQLSDIEHCKHWMITPHNIDLFITNRYKISDDGVLKKLNLRLTLDNLTLMRTLSCQIFQ